MDQSPNPNDAGTMAAVRSDEVAAFARGLSERLERALTLEHAAQQFAHEVHRWFPESTALARVYVTLPAYRLPARERTFAERVAGGPLDDETCVLTLLGTAGTASEWNERRRSHGHLAIPLTNAQTVRRIPMVASLLQALGVDIAWFDAPREVLARKLVGGFNGLFHVQDANSAEDADGRKIIPAQQFVSEQHIRTVFGVGGAYLNGWLAVAILFTREDLSPAQAQRFAPLAGALKLGTMHQVAQGRVFAAASLAL